MSKPDNIPFLGSKRRFLCLFRDCCGCRLVVTSEPLDLDLNAARRGAVWWKKDAAYVVPVVPSLFEQ